MELLAQPCIDLAANGSQLCQTSLITMNSSLGSANWSYLCINSSSNPCNGTESVPLSKSSASIIIAIIITALYSIVCVLGLVGNVLVMYVIV
eukprot:g33825.t1